MFRTIILSSVLLAGLSGAALAGNGDTNIEEFVAQQPHSEPVSEGTAVVVDVESGDPQIRYEGRPQGNLSRGLPVVVDNQDGQPVIEYRQPAGMTAKDHDPDA